MKEFFARLNPTERRFVVGVLVVFFLVVNMVWIWPHFGDWGKTRAELDKWRGLLGRFAAGTNQIPTLKKAIANYAGQGQFVPLENQAVQLYQIVQRQAAFSGVGIINIGGGTRQATTDNPFFVEQNQTITTLSGEKQLVDFLYHLGADSNSLIRVKVLSVQPDPPRQNLNARITLVASYQKTALTAPPKTAAHAPAAAAPKPAAPRPATPETPRPATTVGPTGVRPGQLPQRPPPPPPGGRPFLPMRSNLLTPNKK